MAHYDENTGELTLGSSQGQSGKQNTEHSGIVSTIFVALFWLVAVIAGPTWLTTLYLVVAALVIAFIVAPKKGKRFGEIVANNNTTFFVVLAMAIVTTLIALFAPAPKPITAAVVENVKAWFGGLMGHAPTRAPSSTRWSLITKFFLGRGTWGGTAGWFWTCTAISFPICFWDEAKALVKGALSSKAPAGVTGNGLKMHIAGELAGGAVKMFIKKLVGIK